MKDQEGRKKQIRSKLSEVPALFRLEGGKKNENAEGYFATS